MIWQYQRWVLYLQPWSDNTNGGSYIFNYDLTIFILAPISSTMIWEYNQWVLYPQPWSDNTNGGSYIFNYDLTILILAPISSTMIWQYSDGLISLYPQPWFNKTHNGTYILSDHDSILSHGGHQPWCDIQPDLLNHDLSILTVNPMLSTMICRRMSITRCLFSALQTNASVEPS